MSDTALTALITALVTGPLVVTLGKLVDWWRGRRRDDAEVGRTLDERWKAYADQVEARMLRYEKQVGELEGRVDQLESELETERSQVRRLRQQLRVMVRHAMKLREALAAHGGQVPAMPAEVEDVVTSVSTTDD